jgi:tetratricopeptide (TPR) repeat protein
MGRLLHAAGFWVLMGLLSVAGAALLGAAAWLAPLRAADEALQAGDYRRVIEEGAAAEARFDALPIARRLLPDGYALSQSHQMLALYRLGEHETLLEKAARSLDRAPAHFWAGCAHFTRAAGETDRPAKIAALTRASEEFRKAIDLAPGDWDAKHDYELAERLLAQLREPPKAPPKQRLQLLRPQPREGGRPVRRIG